MASMHRVVRLNICNHMVRNSEFYKQYVPYNDVEAYAARP